MGGADRFPTQPRVGAIIRLQTPPACDEVFTKPHNRCCLSAMATHENTQCTASLFYPEKTPKKIKVVLQK